MQGRSTQTAVFKFTQDILEALENGEIPLGLFLDLSKAYDTLNHHILFKKLDLYGIRGVTLKWIESYISGREQKVVIGKGTSKTLSKTKNVITGIPQGSVIGFYLLST